MPANPQSIAANTIPTSPHRLQADHPNESVSIGAVHPYHRHAFSSDCPLWKQSTSAIPANPIARWIWLTCLLLACSTVTTSAQQEIAQHRMQVEQMTASEKESLRIKRSRFQQLTSQQKDELRQLHAALSQRPELQQTMKAYYTWLTTLFVTEMAELKQLSPRQRVEQIKRLRRNRPSKAINHLPTKQRPPFHRRSPERLERFFYKLTPAEQEEIDRMRPSAAEAALQRRYREYQREHQRPHHGRPDRLPHGNNRQRKAVPQTQP